MNEASQSLGLRPGAMSIHTSRIVEALKGCEPGTTLTDESLSKTAGADVSVGGRAYQSLLSAMKHVRKNYGLVWYRIRGTKSIRCATAADVDTAVTSRRKQINRMAKRSTDETCIALAGNDMPEDLRRKLTVEAAVAGSLDVMTRTTSAKALESRNVNRALDMQKMLEAFAK